MFLAKTKLYSIKLLTIKLYNLDWSVSVNNVLRVYNEVKEQIKNLKNATEYTI